MKKLLSPWMALVTLVLMIVIRLADPTFVESVRLRYFDQLITSKEATVSEHVAVVNIDDATIKQKGQFPFPRGDYSKIIEDILKRNAGLVVFNVYMPDSDRFHQDSQLAATLKNNPVILPQLAEVGKVTTDVIPFRPGVSVIGGNAKDTGVKYDTIYPTIFNNSAAGIGVVNTLPEVDGVTRRIPMVVNANGNLYPSISLETLRVAAGQPSFQVKVNDNAIQAVRIAQLGKIETDELGRIWVDPTSRPAEYSAINLPKDFGGKIVIVGLTAKGLNNPVATAGGAQFPHYIQAEVLDTVISGTNISRPDWSLIAELGFMIVAVLLSLYLTRFTHGYIFAILLGFVAYYGGMELFVRHQYLLDAVFPILTIGICSFHGYIVKFLVELRQKLQIKKQFGTYLSPALVEKLQRQPELLKLGGESRELSIMFTDVRGFTSISEHYGEDVQGLTQIMNRYMTAMTSKIIENNGTLDKYIGDAQMAFWNAPLDEPEHAKMALKTALQMMESLDEFNSEITKEGVPPFGMGLGINTGTVVVGNMGSDQRFDYTCLGDSVNLASRLEGQSKSYGVRIILGQQTARYVQDQYPVAELDCIAVKGKKIGVKIFTPAIVYSLHPIWLENYYSGNWDAAIAMVDSLKAESPELSQYYDNMVERMQEGKPADWDGTYRATSK
jgi:adenylate cyclase